MADSAGNNKMIPLALVATLISGAGGTALIGGQSSLQGQHDKLEQRMIDNFAAARQAVTELRAEASAEERRVLAEMVSIDKSSGDRARRIRTELESEIKELRARLDAMPCITRE